MVLRNSSLFLQMFAIFDGHGRFLLILLNFLYNFSFFFLLWKIQNGKLLEIMCLSLQYRFLCYFFWHNHNSSFFLQFFFNIFIFFFQCSLRSNNFLNCGNIQNGKS